MQTLDSLYQEGYARIFREDSAQMGFLQTIANLRRMPVQPLLDNEMLFVPNDEYLTHYFGESIAHPSYGCYSNGACVWANQLIVPIKNLAGVVKGFAAFNPFNYAEAKETGDKSITYYSYSSKDVFPKSKYLFCPGDSYARALDDGYLLLVDGLFDAVSLRYAGFNAAALLGSIPTQYLLMQLRFVKRVILLADNDEAGYKLFTALRRQLRNVELYKQASTKDADELLRSEQRDEFIASLTKVVKEGDVSLLPIRVFGD